MIVYYIKNEIMFQTNNDADDLGDFLPYLMDYINEGYDKLVHAYAGTHVGVEIGNYKPLTSDQEEPRLPEWMHRALVDWATWLVYRNGNPQKQNRGYPFRAAFEEKLAKITAEGGKNGRMNRFRNIPQ